MAYNWLMMTSSGDDNRPSGSLGLLTDKTTKKKNKNKTFNKRKNRALLTLLLTIWSPANQILKRPGN